MGMEKLIAILMADLSGYTAMTEVHGPAQAISMVDKFITLTERLFVGRSRLFERVGDQVVVISEDVDDLARTAVALHINSKKETHFLPVQAGLHFGSVLEQYGSFYGSTVNIAARIASEAKDGSLLASFEFITALKNAKSFHYKLYGTRHFKNVLSPTRLFNIIPEVTDRVYIHHVDPVCLYAIGRKWK
jgi:class 3 adenylate cyclase